MSEPAITVVCCTDSDINMLFIHFIPSPSFSILYEERKNEEDIVELVRSTLSIVATPDFQPPSGPLLWLGISYRPLAASSYVVLVRYSYGSATRLLLPTVREPEGTGEKRDYRNNVKDVTCGQPPAAVKSHIPWSAEDSHLPSTFTRVWEIPQAVFFVALRYSFCYWDLIFKGFFFFTVLSLKVICKKLVLLKNNVFSWLLWYLRSCIAIRGKMSWGPALPPPSDVFYDVKISGAGEGWERRLKMEFLASN